MPITETPRHSEPRLRRRPARLHPARSTWALLLTFAALVGAAVAARAQDAQAAQDALAAHVTRATSDAAPAGPWRMLADPDAAGWSTEALDAAHAYAEEIGSAAVMLVERGVVVAAFGAVERPFDLHSVRKSVLSTLYGPAVAAGELRLDATLGELGIDDDTPLTESEKRATVLQLLQSRSGVYLPAAKETPDAKRSRPARGSASPGERFHYNNWDFNVAGVVLSRATGRSVEQLFRDTLAEPLGMQDVGPDACFEQLEPRQSRHPAYAFRLSARDLARFGVLVANGGRLGERALIPADWLATATTLVSEVAPGMGYGRMWWVHEPGHFVRNTRLTPHRVISGEGTGGQVVAILPDAGIVFVHRGDTDNDRHVSGVDVWELFDELLGARTGPRPDAEPATTALRAAPLANVVPPPAPLAPVTLPAALIEATTGRFTSSAGPPAEIFLHDGRLYVTVSDVFEGELVPESKTALRTPHGSTRVEVERDADGRAVALTVHAQGRVMPYRRVE